MRACRYGLRSSSSSEDGCRCRFLCCKTVTRGARVSLAFFPSSRRQLARHEAPIQERKIEQEHGRVNGGSNRA
jgi:hypothetical protein